MSVTPIQRGVYLFYRLASSVRHWIARRLTKAGLLVLAGLVASGAMGLDTNRNLTYQMFSLLFFLSAISIVSGLWFRPRFSVMRRLPRFATAGEPVSYTVQVRNETSRGWNNLLLQEEVSDPRPSWKEFSSNPDRVGASERWNRYVAAGRGVEFEELVVPALPPRGVIEVRPSVVPLRRGRATLAGVTITRPDPFGLFKSQVKIPAEGSLLVLPKRYKVPDVRLPGTRKYQSGGVALASSVADSEEFISLRDYRPGDPLRHIHWKSWAKAGKPIVKEYQDEFFVRHALILDTLAATAGQAIFEEAVSVAASFACSIETQDSLLDLMFVEDQVYTYTAGRGVGGVDRMLEVLAAVQICRDKSFSELRHAVLARRASLSGCLCVLLAWDRDREAFIGDLRKAGVPVLALLVAEGPSSDSSEVGRAAYRRLEVGKIGEGLAAL